MTEEPSSLLQLKQVSKLYGDHQVHALEGVSLSFRRGEFVSLVGPSGCGKSTLLNLIAGVDRPTSGQIFLNGIDLTSCSDEDLTEIRAINIGYVFQFFNLLSMLTVEENVSLPLELVGKHTEKEIKQQVANMLERFGMTERAQFYPAQLSGGEMQRTAIARALVHSPGLILADEPTGNLDTENGRIILELLASLNGELQTTIIMATHSSNAAAFTQRTIQIQDGCVVDETKQCPLR